MTTFDGAIVVGSGPAGVACAHALVSRGQSVLMVDGGDDLPPETTALLAELAGRPPREWPRETLHKLNGLLRPTARGVDKKLVHGSGHVYADGNPLLPIRMEGADFSASLAVGGFSMVWGAGVLGFTPVEFERWPITGADLAPHDDAVSGFMPVAARSDRLEGQFALPAQIDPPLRPSAQGRAILERLEHRAEALSRHGITGGASRLAVFNRAGRECVYCGRCLRGCPLDLIASGRQAVAHLTQSPLFTHRPGLVVQRVEEHDGTVRVHALDRNARPEVIVGRRVFLGCGTLATTRILMESLGWHEREVTMRDSLYFLQPSLMFQGRRGVQAEELHTLAQAFIEIANESVSAHRIHLSAYTYNDLFPQTLRGMFGPIGGLAVRMLGPLISRLILVGGYLHSDDSPRMSLTLARSHDDRPGMLTVKSAITPEARAAVARVVRLLARVSRHTGFHPVRPMLSMQGPGRGFHSGASFPMRDEPCEGESDRLGTIHGFSRVHAVDSTIFPDIPSGPITGVVMANAHRIGTEVAG